MERSLKSAWTLGAPTEVEHTYRRTTCGPSGYASVTFRCEPSPVLSFSSAAEWPDELGPKYTALFQRAVEKGVVEAFNGGKASTSRTCNVVLLRVGCHNVQSSELAFRRAATEALSSLLNKDALWTSPVQ